MMDYAVAVNEEVRNLFAAGADIVQLDEPYTQARPEKADDYGLEALNRALDGIEGETAVHICFGYAAIIHERPAFDVSGCKVIETAQSEFHGVGLNKKLFGVLNLANMEIKPETIAHRRPCRMRHCTGFRISATQRRLRENESNGRRCRHRPRRTLRPIKLAYHASRGWNLLPRREDLRLKGTLSDRQLRSPHLCRRLKLPGVSAVVCGCGRCFRTGKARRTRNSCTRRVRRIP